MNIWSLSGPDNMTEAEGVDYLLFGIHRRYRQLLREESPEAYRAGVQDLLEQLLVHRFGPLDSYAMVYLNNTKLEELETMSKRLFDGKTIDDVLYTPFHSKRAEVTKKRQRSARTSRRP